MNNNSDQIRTLQNVVVLEGALAELDEPRYGVTADGTNYISIRGVVQCGDEAVYCKGFRGFFKQKKVNGEDSKVYKDVQEWLKTATPMTKDAENPTMVRLQGSLTDNVYVSREGRLVETNEVSVQFINEFKNFGASLQLEGYIKDIRPEVKGKDEDAKETGRYRLHFYSRDFYGKTIELKSIVIPAEAYNDICAIGYDEGVTAKLNMEWQVANGEEAPKKKTGGFGKQVDLSTTSGTSYLELVLVGGSDPYEEDSKDAISAKAIRILISNRAAHLKEVEANGYLGSNKGGASVGGFSAPKNSFGSAKSAATAGTFSPVEEVSDDEIPF